jgi:hypothetical protein
MNVDQKLVQKFVALTNKKRALEEECDAVADELKALSDQLVDQFTRAAIQNVKLGNGKGTLHLHERILACKVDHNMPPAEIIAALKKARLSEFVSTGVAWQRLHSFVAELEREGKKLPATVAKVLTTEHQFSVRLLAR